MLHSEWMFGRFRLGDVLGTAGTTEWVQALDDGDSPTVLAVFRSHGEAESELTRLEQLACPGIPRAVERAEGSDGSAAASFPEMSGARPVASQPLVEPAAVRPLLARLLSVLSHAHSNGLGHGHIGPRNVFVAPGGRAWLVGWAGARRLPDGGRHGQSPPGVEADLAALGGTVRALLTPRLGPDPSDVASPLPPGLDRDVVRVIEQLAGASDRAAYRDASEALADLGEPDQSLPDAWRRVPLVGGGGAARVLLQILDDLPLPAQEGVEHVAALEVIGPSGSGKTRILAELAAAARARGAHVLSARGDCDPGWGGVGALLRQAIRLVRDTDEELELSISALRRFLDTRPTAEQEEQERDPPDEASIRILTTAANDLIEKTFRDTTGVLLIDDAGTLRPLARELWKAIGRFVHAQNENGDTIRVVLVAAFDTLPDDDPSYRTERIELAEWDLPQVERLCAAILSGPELEFGFAERVFRTLGGRPGDVLGYLRGLERDGCLVREADRWTFVEPPPAPTTNSERLRSAVRDALDTIGPDGRRLVEALAVSGPARLPHQVLPRLTSVSGPRLYRAAQRALEAGLIERAGTSWSIRGDFVRQRVLGSIDGDQRLSLHRELLHHFGQGPQPSAEVMAYHARNAQSPDAADWTRRAVDALRSRHRYDEAIEHIREGRALLRDPYWLVHSRVDLADLLRLSGRLGDAIREYEEYVSDPRATPSSAAEACLALVQSLYDAREWDRVIDVPLPEDTATPECLCRIRLLRAAAFSRLRYREKSSREQRLARAELPELSWSVHEKIIHAELQYHTAVVMKDWISARHALIQKLRFAASCRSEREKAHALAVLANVIRWVGDATLCRKVLMRSNLVATKPNVMEIRALTLNRVTESLLESRESEARSTGLLAEAIYLCKKAGLERWKVVPMLRYVRKLSILDPDSTHTYREYRRLAGMSLQWTRTDFVEGSSVLAPLSFRFGDMLNCERMSERVRELPAESAIRRRVTGFLQMSRMQRNLPPWPEFTTPDSQQSWIDLARELETSCNAQSSASVAGSELRSAGLGLAAYGIRMGATRHGTWPAGWGARELAERSARSAGLETAADVACALALWSNDSFDEAIWGQLVVAVDGALVPPSSPLHWQVLLVKSRELRRRGRVAASMGELEASRVSAQRSSMNSQWKLVATEFERRHCGGERSATHVPASSTSSTSSAEIGTPDGELEILGRIWAKELSLSRSRRSSIVVAGGGLECELFAVLASSSTRPDIVESLSRGMGDRDRAELILKYARSWTADELGRALDVVSTRSRREDLRTLVLISRFDFEHAEAHLVSELSDSIDGGLIFVPDPLGEGDSRVELFQAMRSKTGSNSQVEPSAHDLIAMHDWPGGLQEMQALSSVLPSSTATSGNALELAGWTRRWRPSCVAALDRTGVRILQVVRANPSGAQVAEIASATDVSRRSVQRRLRELVRAKAITKHGQGRATYYRGRY